MKKIDPRWFVLINHFILVSMGMLFFGLQRDGLQVAFCLVLTNGTELLAARVFKKHATFNVGDRLLSATIVALAILLLIRSSDWWFYGVLGSLAILSKYVLLNPDGRHVFNPTNFAIVFSVAFMPDHLFVRPDQFSSDSTTFYILLPVVLACGSAAAITANRWRTTVAYYVIAIGLGVPLGALLHVKPWWVIAPEINTSTFIFALLMITDPRTTPSAPRSQWLFATIVSFMHLYFRHLQVPYSNFVALFFMTGVWPVAADLLSRRLRVPATAS